MPSKKIKKENNDFIFKYQKKDVNVKLSGILGEDFKKYREDFEKTQNYIKTKFIPDFPITVSLELLNRCNLNCIMCYKKHHRQPKAELTLDVLQKIMNECKENKLPSIALGLGAEILMYKNIKELLSMVKTAGIQDIFFGTNGVLLNDELIELIVKNKITRVKISLDAATKETYKKIRGFDLLKRVEENIEKIIACKKKYNRSLPMIRLSFVVMDINRHETQRFVDKWKNKVDYIDFQRCIDFSHVDKPIEINQQVIKDSFCAYPFYSLNIWADGAISPCCTFYGRKLIFGNIYNETLKNIWQSEKMKKIREHIVSKRFNPVCQRCLYFRDKDIIDSSFQK